MKTAEDLERAVGRTVSKSFVYTLLHLWNQTFGDLERCRPQDVTGERIRRKRFLPHLKYLMKRHAKTREDLSSIEHLIQPVFPWIKLPVYWTSLRLRREDH